MSNGEHEIRTPKGLRIGNRSVVDGKIYGRRVSQFKEAALLESHQGMCKQRKTSSNGVLKTESSIPRSCAGRLYPAYASGSCCICRCMRFNLNDFRF